MKSELEEGRAAFDGAFAALGSRAKGTQWTALLKSPRSTLELNAKSHEVLRHGHIDFVKNPTFNAAATHQNGWALVACHTGTAEVLTTLFSFLLSQPDCLIGIGKSEKETRWIASLAGCEWAKGRKAIESQLVVCRKVEDCLPRCEKRRWWAAFLTSLSLEFVYFHEFGHIVQGHVPVDGSVALELGGTALDQYCELEADAWAARALLSGMLDLVGTENLPTQRSVIGALTIAVFFVFLILDPDRARLNDYRGTHHPHPAVRMSAYMVVLEDAAGDSSTRDMIANSFAQSYLASLQSAEALQMRGASLQFLKDGEEIGEEYLRIVDAGNASRLRDQ